MNRAQRLVYCEKCTLREFSGKSGLVCSLTKEQAAFEGTCPDFKEDIKEVIQQKEKIKANNSNSIWAGAGMIIGAFVWFFVGLFALDRIFFYPPILLVLGIIALVKGLNERKSIKAREKSTLLDGDL